MTYSLTKFGTKVAVAGLIVFASIILACAYQVAYGQEVADEPVTEVATYANMPIADQVFIQRIIASTSIAVSDAIKISEERKNTISLSKHLESIDAYLGDISRTLHKIANEK